MIELPTQTEQRVDIGEFDSRYGRAKVYCFLYVSNKALAVMIETEDKVENDELVEGFLWTLSANLRDQSDKLLPGEFYAKTYSENEPVAIDAMASGLFVDMGTSTRSGFVECPLWKIKGT